MVLTAGIGAAILVAQAVQQASVAPSPVQPDRPNFTNSAHIAPIGHPYLELGYRQTRLGNQTSEQFGDGATFRLGLSQNFEARMGVPTYTTLHGGGATTAGFADEFLAFKWRLTPEISPGHPAVAVEGSAEIPSGARGLRGPQWQPAVTLIGSYAADSRTEIDSNLIYSKLADAIGKYDQFSASIAASRDLGKGYGAFIEFFTNRSQTGRVDNSSYADAGVTKLVNPIIQIDAFIGQGVNGVGKDYFFGFGASIQF